LWLGDPPNWDASDHGVFWCLWKALGKEGSMTFELAVQKVLEY